MQLVLSQLQQMSVSLVIAYLFSKSPLLRPLANYSVRLPHKIPHVAASGLTQRACNLASDSPALAG